MSEQAGWRGPQSHQVNSSAGAEAVVETHPVLVLRVLAPGQDVHVAREVGPFVHGPGASLHSNGVAATQVHVEIGAVAVTVIVAALKVLVLIESDLKCEANKERNWGVGRLYS